MIRFKAKHPEGTPEEMFVTLGLKIGAIFKGISGFVACKKDDDIIQLDAGNDFWLSNEGDYEYKFGGRYMTRVEDVAFGIVLSVILDIEVIDTEKYEHKSNSVGKMRELLKEHNQNAILTNEQNMSFIHIINGKDGNVILSTQKPIGVCNRTGSYVYPTTTPGYSAFCPELDEDLYLNEFTKKD